MADIAHAFTWFIDDKGLLTLATAADTPLRAQPLASLVSDGQILRPLSAAREGDRLTLTYACGAAAFALDDRGEYLRIEALSVPDGTDALLFGPYMTEKTHCGTLIGAAWDDSFNTVCIQSLNPKTVGGFPPQFETLHPCYGHDRLPEYYRTTFTDSAALPVDGGAALQCYALDMSRPATHDVGIGSNCGSLDPGEGVTGAEACYVPGDDAYIPGAAITLIACGRDELLDIIGRMEVQEGLPHPTIDGVWVKKAPRATEPYMMIGQASDGLSYEETLDIIKEAGLRCFYDINPFVSWGHFGIDPERYPGGDEGLKRAVDQAAEKGLDFGFHTLSNFINTNDPYVTPVPSEHLLIMDTTTLVSPLDEADTVMIVKERKNYMSKSHLNVVKIGNELIQYDICEKAEGGWKLTDLVRGAFGTAVSAHAAGEKVYRLQDHGYKTLFPDLIMQREMATRMGELIKKTGVKRMSFDGMEGCLYTGRGEYACSEYVRRVFEIVGSELICDASTPSHYRWHAHTYFNWGEPHYDYQRRGGMFRYREDNVKFFSDNLMNCMLGQYSILLAGPKFEAMKPENLEFELSQAVAHNAGFGLEITFKALKEYGQVDYLFKLLKTWEDMRFHGDVPASIREAMKDEHANWHLEATDGGWTLQKLRLQTYDFGYRTDKPYPPANHAELIMIDRPVPGGPLKLRLRVGEKRCKGQMTYLGFHAGWGGFFPLLKFMNIAVEPGDYLVYTGGTTIDRYDANFNFIETLEGEGEELIAQGQICGFDVHYALTEDSDIEPFATVFQAVDTIFIPRRADR